MDRSEPAFVPEWLKSSGSVTVGLTNQSKSFLCSDDQSGSKHARKKPSLSRREHDKTWSVVPKTTSPNFLHQSDSSKDTANSRMYGSINCNHRDREREDFNGFRDKSKSFQGEHGLHSQSMIKRKQDFSFPKKVLGDSVSINNSSSNGQLLSVSNDRNSSQPILEQEFPSLGTEKGHDSELRSACSPNGRSSVVNQQVNGLNMAEAVVQGPSRVRTPPQLSVDTQTQRLQELAIKQSRQLIPMTPKPMSPSPLDKPKLKAGQQQPQFLPIQLGNQTKTSCLGKLQVLKSSREVNGGVALTVKDSIRPVNGVLNTSPNRNPFSTQNPVVGEERKLGPADSEKRTSLQCQSRNDFFNLIKKKSSAIPNVEVADTVSWKSSLSDAQMENGATNGQCCSDNHIPSPDEEEAAFLHSLGWEEGSGGFEGLTKEEISEFIEYINTRPASELEGIHSLRLKNGRWGPIC